MITLGNTQELFNRQYQEVLPWVYVMVCHGICQYYTINMCFTILYLSHAWKNVSLYKVNKNNFI